MLKYNAFKSYIEFGHSEVELSFYVFYSNAPTERDRKNVNKRHPSCNSCLYRGRSFTNPYLFVIYDLNHDLKAQLIE